MGTSRYWQVFAGVGVLLAGPAAAQAPRDAAISPCFQIVQPTANEAPFEPIKLNTCTGELWLLVRMPLEKGFFTYRWQPLAHAEPEPMLHENPIQIMPTH